MTGITASTAITAAFFPSRHTRSTEFVLAKNAGDHERVYKLRYHCYRRKESIEQREDERFEDRFDSLPNTFSFLLRSAADEPLATVRINVVTPSRGWTESPAQQVYNDHPRLQEIAGESFVEANRLCFAEQARRDTFVGLVGHMAAMADVFETRWLVACPRVEHAEIYQRLFGFEVLAAPRQYFGVSFATQLLGISREHLNEYVYDKKPLYNAWQCAKDYLTRALIDTANTRTNEHGPNCMASPSARD
jgi:hypothetical protein